LADIVVSTKFPGPQSDSLCRPLNFGCSWPSTSTSFPGVTPQLPFLRLHHLRQSLYLLKAHQSLRTSLTPNSPSCTALYKSFLIPYSSTSSSTTSTSSFLPSFLSHTTTSKARSSLKVSHSHISGPSILYKPHSSFPAPTPQHLLPSSAYYNNNHFLISLPVLVTHTPFSRSQELCRRLGKLHLQYPGPWSSIRAPFYATFLLTTISTSYTFLVTSPQHTPSPSFTTT
jgi:hypothetical protein